MTETVAKLIEVFSQKDAAGVTDNDIVKAFWAEDYSEVEAKPDFAKAFIRIRRAKLKLERIVHYYPQAENQALHCLAELNAERGRYRDLPDSFRETEALIRKGLYPYWGDIQEEFDARCEVLGKWNDVFVSYTNRDAFATNQRYADLVRHEWGRKVDPAETSWNCIASTIAKYLQQNNLRTFYDYKKLKCGDDIEDEIRKHSSSAIALVQLLEPQVFEEPEAPKKNWCKEEFDEFSQSQPPQVSAAATHNRYFFVLARGDNIEDVLPAYRPPHYMTWIDKASRKLHLTLNNYQMDFDRKDFDRLRIKVRKVADQIVDAREKIINAMLASW